MFIKYIGRIVFAPEDGTGTGAPPVVAPPVTPPVVIPPVQTAHPVAAPWGAGTETWKIGEGETAVPWYDTITEEPVRESMKAKDYKTPAEVAMAYHNLMKMQRNPGDALVIPPENATPEQVNEFYTKLGRPEAADKYELKMPEGVTSDPAMVDFAKKVSFDLGLNPKQAQTLADKWNEFAPNFNAAQIEASTAANNAAIAALETTWGADLETNKAAGLRAMQSLGLSAETVNAIDAQIGAAPIVELLAKIGRKSDEGGFKGSAAGGDPNDPAGMTKEQASARIVTLQGDMAFQAKYTNKTHPEHAQAVQYMEKLFSKA